MVADPVAGVVTQVNACVSAVTAPTCCFAVPSSPLVELRCEVAVILDSLRLEQKLCCAVLSTKCGLQLRI